MGFIPHIILPTSNLTYNQIIQGVVNGIYDMVIGDVTITAIRREKVSFSNSIFDNSVRIIMRSVDLL
jgi:ABC-type amino acid transport substrate-binding protein